MKDTLLLLMKKRNTTERRYNEESKKSDAEKDRLIEEGKIIGINKIIRPNNVNTQSKKKNFFFDTKMTKSADTYAENYVHTLKVDKKDNKSVLWIKMHDIQGKLGRC